MYAQERPQQVLVKLLMIKLTDAFGLTVGVAVTSTFQPLMQEALTVIDHW